MKESSHIQSNRAAGYSSIDLLRFICAFLVVAIHAPPFGEEMPHANFIVCELLARISVPVFFAISGFLFFSRLSWENGKISVDRYNTDRFVRCVKRNAQLYSGWAIFYILISLPSWHRSGWWGIPMIKDAAVAFVVRGSYYHLWYLLALVYAIPILFVLLKHMNRTYVMWLVVVPRLAEGLLFVGTQREIGAFVLISGVLNKLPILYSVVFRAIPLLSVGILCATAKTQRKIRPVWVFASGAFYVFEAVVRHYFFSEYAGFSYALSMPVFAYMLLRYLIGSKQPALSKYTQSVIRSISTTVYCLHPMVIHFCEFFKIPDGLVKYFTTVVFTVLLAWAWAEFERRKRSVCV